MMQEKALIILCGPSGSGKTTIAHHLLHAMPRLTFSVSATTRPKRENETNGVDYHFLSVSDFREKIASDEFVESEEVYKDVFYGTLKSELQRIWSSGKVPVLDIDVVGALNIKRTFAPDALAIFVHPVTLDNLKQRLQKRATETADSFAKRIEKAETELAMAEEFENFIYNDDLDRSFKLAKDYVSTYLKEEPVKSK